MVWQKQGLAFAIPINVALEVVEQLKAKGKVSRGYLGVQGQEVSSDLAEALGMDKPIGALVSFVLEGEASPSKTKLTRAPIGLSIPNASARSLETSCPCTPKYPLETFPFALSCSTTSKATLIGMAKARPCFCHTN